MFEVRKVLGPSAGLAGPLLAKLERHALLTALLGGPRNDVRRWLPTPFASTVLELLGTQVVDAAMVENVEAEMSILARSRARFAQVPDGLTSFLEAEVACRKVTVGCDYSKAEGAIQALAAARRKLWSIVEARRSDPRSVARVEAVPGVLPVEYVTVTDGTPGDRVE